MPITLEGFKAFARIYQPRLEALPSVGALTLRRASQARPWQPITIDQGAIFLTSQLRFAAIQAVTITESASFAPCLVQCQSTGNQTNIPSGETWAAPLATITAENESAFAGGQDARPQTGDPADALYASFETDEILQDILNTGISMIRKKVGLMEGEDLIDSPEIKHAVYLYSQFLRQQRNFQERRRQLGENAELNFAETSYFRQGATMDALNRQLDNLLSTYINVKRFMP